MRQIHFKSWCVKTNEQANRGDFLSYWKLYLLYQIEHTVTHRQTQTQRHARPRRDPSLLPRSCFSFSFLFFCKKNTIKTRNGVLLMNRRSGGNTFRKSLKRIDTTRTYGRAGFSRRIFSCFAWFCALGKVVGGSRRKRYQPTSELDFARVMAEMGNNWYGAETVFCLKWRTNVQGGHESGTRSRVRLPMVQGRARAKKTNRNRGNH